VCRKWDLQLISLLRSRYPAHTIVIGLVYLHSLQLKNYIRYRLAYLQAWEWHICAHPVGWRARGVAAFFARPCTWQRGSWWAGWLYFLQHSPNALAWPVYVGVIAGLFLGPTVLKSAHRWLGVQAFAA
jgi:hypothetical protein